LLLQPLIPRCLLIPRLFSQQSLLSSSIPSPFHPIKSFRFHHQILPLPSNPPPTFARHCVLFAIDVVVANFARPRRLKSDGMRAAETNVDEAECG
jgi:hypothetical protein